MTFYVLTSPVSLIISSVSSCHRFFWSMCSGFLLDLLHTVSVPRIYHAGGDLALIGISEVFITQSCLTVTPWTVARQALLFMGFSRQEFSSGSPCPSPGDLPGPGIIPGSLALPMDSFTFWAI